MLDAAEIAPDASADRCDPMVAFRQAVALEEQGQPAAGRALMRTVAGLVPDWDEPWVRIGQSFRAEGLLQDAVTAYGSALHRNPDRIEALLARGVVALGQGRAVDALADLRRVVALEPTQHQAWHALGYAYAATGLHGVAVEAIATAGRLAPSRFAYARDYVELCARVAPNVSADPPSWSADVAFGLAGLAARDRGAFEDAIELLEAAVTLAPDEPDMLKELAALYLTMMRPEAAEPLLRQAHHLAPHDITTLNNLAVTLGRLYRFGEATGFMDLIKSERRATPAMLFNRATLRASVGDLDGSRRDIEAAKATTTDLYAALAAECPLLPYRSFMTAAALRDAMIALGNSLPCDNAPLMHPHYHAKQDEHRPLRIGLLSNSLRQHPVAWLTFAGLTALDSAQFGLHCFGHYEPDDSFAPAFSRHVQGWHRVDGLNEAATAALISDHDIDILIDLSGFGDGGLIGATAYRPAPVQIKWVGSQASTTGIPAMDWMITDRWETPDGYEQFYTERLLRLPDGYVCYTPPPTRTPVNPLPALETGFITFGCFNNLAKLNDDSLRLWAQLLDRLPTARLQLRCPQLSEAAVLDRFIARATGLGIDAARLITRGRARHPEFIAGYRDIDIALDPYPYSGGLTTCEALFMGVPVITLAGDFFAARHSVSHLSNVGVPGCIATTTAEYLDKAVAMASDLPALAALRAGLRERVLASPLCDTARFGKNLGDALRFAWRDYCQRLSDVPD